MNKKWLLLLIPLFLIILVVISLKTKNNSPTLPIAPTPTMTDSTQNTYQGVYFSFNYPKTFDISKVNTTDGRVLENWLLTEKDTDSPTTITVSLFASNKDLSTFEPVQARRSDTSQFLEEIGRMRDLRGILFRTIDRKERTVYFTNNRRILSVDYIAKTNDPVKEVEYQKLLDGIIWE